MARDTRKEFRRGSVKARTQVKNPKTRHYTKRNETPGSRRRGEFMDVRSSSKSFKGIAKEVDHRRKKAA